MLAAVKPWGTPSTVTAVIVEREFAVVAVSVRFLTLSVNGILQIYAESLPAIRAAEYSSLPSVNLSALKAVSVFCAIIL